jgi:hypothetical protein
MAALAATWGCSSHPEPVQSRQALGVPDVEPNHVSGNPTCADLGLGTYSIKIDPPVSGTFALGPLDSVTTTISADGVYVDWTSTLGIDAVIVKGGPAANVYVYSPESVGDDQLSSPINSSGNPAEISHIDFCYDYEVKVAKTAATSFKRTFDWTIAKSAAQDAITQSEGQTFTMGYEVTVNTTGYTDSDFAAQGQITVVNPAPFAATITGVTDDLPGGTVAVECGVSFPHALAAGATLVCSYTASLPDASNRTNTATVATEGSVGGGSATAAVDFASAVITTIDECVDVTDSLEGPLGPLCVGAGETSASKKFEYTYDIGPAVCGDNDVVNTASFVTNDTGEAGSASDTVAVHVECSQGWTLTPGYWKTHSSLGPAPYDETWAQLPQGAHTPFFLSGASYHQVLWTPPAGNSYYILSHAYIAAQLNGLNGANTAVVAAALAEATTLFQTYTPAAIKALKPSSAVRQRFVTLGGLLDAYNNGLTGPGHCSE